MLSTESERMSVDNSIDPDLKLIKQLLELNGLSNSKGADVMGVQRSNLSSWLNGKAFVFSIKKIDSMLSALGMRALSDPVSHVRLCYLAPEIVHRWQVEEGAPSLIDVLRKTEPKKVLEGLEIFRVNAYPRGCFNILRGERQNGVLLMLIANRDPSAQDYPLSPEMLGFGRLAGTIEMSLEQWIGWWKEPALPIQEFGTQIYELMGTASAGQGADRLPLDRTSGSVDAQLVDCQCQVAGLSALIIALINEVDRLEAGNRLLNKDEQRRIIKEGQDRERQKRAANG